MKSNVSDYLVGRDTDRLMGIMAMLVEIRFDGPIQLVSVEGGKFQPYTIKEKFTSTVTPFLS